MEWTEVKIYTATEGIEAVCAMLFDIGITGVMIQDDADLEALTKQSGWDYIDEELLNKEAECAKVIVYLTGDCHGRDLLLNVKDGLHRLKSMELEIPLGSLEIETSNLDDEDWLNSWKKYYKPFTIAERILIKPFWEEAENPESRLVFNINPGNVFGTGLHQSTQLCISQLERYVNHETEILDLGCGSGILSLISLLLGAKSAFLVDLDPNAIQTVHDNARLNNIPAEKYTVISGNIIDDKNVQDNIGYDKYTIVAANIVADVIVAVSPLVVKQLKDGGVFITSGIIRERLNDVYDALRDNNFKATGTFYKDDWVCVVSRLKKSGDADA